MLKVSKQARNVADIIFEILDKHIPSNPHRTWSSEAGALLAELGLPTVLQWSGGAKPPDAHEAKRLREQYLQGVVKPAVQQSEQKWQQQQMLKYPSWQPMGMSALAEPTQPLWTLRAWSQFRLQKHFTGTLAPSCPLCGSAHPPDIDHLLGSCGVVQDILSHAGRPWHASQRVAWKTQVLQPADVDVAAIALDAVWLIRQSFV